MFDKTLGWLGSDAIRLFKTEFELNPLRVTLAKKCQNRCALANTRISLPKKAGKCPAVPSRAFQMNARSRELEDVYFSTLIAHNLKDNLE